MSTASLGSAARAWLPDAALRTAPVEAVLAAALDDWSAEWLARRRLKLVRALARADGRAVGQPDLRWSVLGGELALGVPGRASLFLARAMLDAAEGDEPTTDEDRRIVDAVLRDALDDLRRRIAALLDTRADRWIELPEDEAHGLDGPWEGEIALGAGATMLRIALSPETIVSAIKNDLPRPVPGTPLASRAEALRRQPVSVSARIGSTRVSLAELGSLSVGDVIVLDAPLDTPADLAIDGVARPGLGCTVERREADFSLTLLHSLQGLP